MQNIPKKKPTNKTPLSGYARYSGIAGQMLGTILLGTWLGWQTDAWLANTTRYATIFGVVLSVLLALTVALRDLLKK